MTILIVLLVIIIIINLFVGISFGFVVYRNIILEKERRRLMQAKYYSREQIELRKRY